MSLLLIKQFKGGLYSYNDHIIFASPSDAARKGGQILVEVIAYRL